MFRHSFLHYAYSKWSFGAQEQLQQVQLQGCAVAEWSKALLKREKINEKHKIYLQLEAVGVHILSSCRLMEVGYKLCY